MSSPPTTTAARPPYEAATCWYILAGLALLAAAWAGPLPGAARGSFAAHMALHLTVVALAAPLLAFGMAGGRLDPVPRFPAAFSPIGASLLDLAVIWGWHAPAAHEFARQTRLGLVAEQASFLAAGLVLWLAVAGGSREERRARAGPGVIALLLTSMHMTLLGVLLAMAPRALYSHSGAGAHALEDQQLGGLLMLAGAGSVYVLGGLFAVSRLLRDAEAHTAQSGA